MQKLIVFFKRKKYIWLLCYPMAIVSILSAKNNEYMAEKVFSGKIYKVYSQFVSFVTGVFPFSIAELFILLMPLAATVMIILWFIKLIKHKEGKIKRAADGIFNVVIALGILMLIFVIGCGVNYYRYPFSHYAGLTVEKYSKEDLYELCISLTERTNEARENLGVMCENEEGVYKLNIKIDELGKKAKKAFIILSEELPVLSGRYSTPKPVLNSKILSRMGITGIFFPFTMEANVNIHIPDYSIASTMCHELAHLHGFMREDEANYISYLACVKSGDADLIYSGLMEALILAGNALYKMDKELYYEIRMLYSDALKRDLNDNSLYWIQFEDDKLNETANKINDTYLKANNQTDGLQSYGRMVDLLLAEYKAIVQ